MRPYSAAPASSSNFAESSFAPDVGGNGDRRSGQERSDRILLPQRGSASQSTDRGLPTARSGWEPRAARERVKQMLLAPKRTGSSAGSPVSLGDLGDRARARRRRRAGAACSPLCTRPSRVRAGSEMRSWSSTRSVSGGIACPGQPSISVDPAAWQRTNACGAATVNEARASRPSTSDGRASPAPRRRGASRRAVAPSTTSRSAAPARKSETTASTAIPTPRSRSRSARSARTPTSSPRRRASRSSSTATVFFPIAQSEPTVSTIVASTSRFAPVGTFSPAGGLRRSRSSTPSLAGELGELRDRRR